MSSSSYHPYSRTLSLLHERAPLGGDDQEKEEEETLMSDEREKLHITLSLYVHIKSDVCSTFHIFQVIFCLHLGNNTLFLTFSQLYTIYYGSA